MIVDFIILHLHILHQNSILYISQLSQTEQIILEEQVIALRLGHQIAHHHIIANQVIHQVKLSSHNLNALRKGRSELPEPHKELYSTELY